MNLKHYTLSWRPCFPSSIHPIALISCIHILTAKSSCLIPLEFILLHRSKPNPLSLILPV
uniref:Uncharacterized protein n=1 Tax=Nomascus leucogenys TaxID=61853 RepID=A0A2I3HXZ0_NOMLE